MNNIVLCGFMGCGKSTVGKNIARKSGRKFLDMDSYIEEKAGMTVSKYLKNTAKKSFGIWNMTPVLSLQDLKVL